MAMETGLAYSRRAQECAELFGSMTAVHPADRQFVDTWADAVTGPVIDAGCGPGQWTNWSRTLTRLPRRQPPSEGLLSWYSVIHHEPSTIQVPLIEFARVLRPGGGLLNGFFQCQAIEKFDHAVLDAYRWPVTGLSRELNGWI